MILFPGARCCLNQNTHLESNWKVRYERKLGNKRATYVLRKGCAEGEDAPPECAPATAPPESFSPSAMSEVAKSFEDWRTDFGTLVIVVVVVLDAEFARNRDCEGELEK